MSKGIRKIQKKIHSRKSFFFSGKTAIPAEIGRVIRVIRLGGKFHGFGQTEVDFEARISCFGNIHEKPNLAQLFAVHHRKPLVTLSQHNKM